MSESNEPLHNKTQAFFVFGAVVAVFFSLSFLLLFVAHGQTQLLQSDSRFCVLVVAINRLVSSQEAFIFHN